MQEISESVHAFSTENNTPQTSAQVKLCLEKQGEEFKDIADEYSITDSKGIVKKYLNQAQDVASVVDSWWVWARESLVKEELNQEKEDWLVHVLLPVVYWHQQMEKSQNPKMKNIYQSMWKVASSTYEIHPMTNTILKEEIEGWFSWADWISKKFQRTSSAIEGRNGYLSQMHHNGRGITENRLKASTVLHNYDTKRSDGTTAAERLFETKFPDVFDWLIEQMSDLPLPRKSRGARIPNPLNSQTVSA